MVKYIKIIIAVWIVVMPVFAKAQDKKFNTLVANFRAGSRDYQSMPVMIKAARKLKNKPLADSIALVYIHEYQDRLTDSASLANSYKFLMMESDSFPLVTSKDKLFEQSYASGQWIDSVFNAPGTANSIVNSIINKEEIKPYIWPGGKPKPQVAWKTEEKRIAKKYSTDRTHRIVLDAKLRWYDAIKDTSGVIKSYTEKLNKYGLDTAGFFAKIIANHLFNDFYLMYSTDKSTLKKAVIWCDLLVRSAPDDWRIIDTYANLLYKAGETNKGLAWEKKALELSKGDKSIAENYEKMKRGIPTWK